MNMAKISATVAFALMASANLASGQTLPATIQIDVMVWDANTLPDSLMAELLRLQEQETPTSVNSVGNNLGPTLRKMRAEGTVAHLNRCVDVRVGTSVGGQTTPSSVVRACPQNGPDAKRLTRARFTLDRKWLLGLTEPSVHAGVAVPHGCEVVYPRRAKQDPLTGGETFTRHSISYGQQRPNEIQAIANRDPIGYVTHVVVRCP